MRRSIRLRLAVSFAGIALLATLALGAVLLAIVRGYYARQERDYLTSNAQAIALPLGAVVWTDPSSEALQAQVESLAFLSQSRTRLRDADGRVVADSGPPEERRIVSFGIHGATPFQQAITATSPITGHMVFISARADPLSHTAEDTPGLMVIKSGPISSSLSTSPDFVLPAAGSLYGFNLGEQAGPPIQRSRQQVRWPIEAADGTLWGYLELSEGPAYGTQIVRSVARGWAIASAVAVVLAAGVGWWVSRSISAPLLHLAQTTAQMTRGDLSVRAQETDRQDELGTLACTFNEMAQRVGETVNTLRSFVSDAAHEIHTPLATLRANLELLPVDDTVRRAQAQVARLEGLTADLLDLSRIEAGYPNTQHKPVGVSALIREISEAYASRAGQANLGFDLVLPDTPLLVHGDQLQLRLALANLLDNAVSSRQRAARCMCAPGRKTHR